MPASGNEIKQERVLKLSPKDNVLVALADLRKGETIAFNGSTYTLATDVRAKHKFATEPLKPGDDVIMYGVLVGKAMKPIAQGEVITPRNMHHQAAPFHEKTEAYRWTPPDVSRWRTKTFEGYHRADGQVGTRNHWLVIPLVFCENRNIGMLKQAFEEEFGFAHRRSIGSRWRISRGSIARAANEIAEPCCNSSGSRCSATPIRKY